MLDQQHPSATGNANETDVARIDRARGSDDVTRGVEVVVEWHGGLETLVHKMRAATAIGSFRPSMICNHGAPAGQDHMVDRPAMPRWTCRFEFVGDPAESAREIPWLLSVIGEHMRWVQVEKLDRKSGPQSDAYPTREMVAL